MGRCRISNNLILYWSTNKVLLNWLRLTMQGLILSVELTFLESYVCKISTATLTFFFFFFLIVSHFFGATSDCSCLKNGTAVFGLLEPGFLSRSTQTAIFSIQTCYEVQHSARVIQALQENEGNENWGIQLHGKNVLIVSVPDEIIFGSKLISQRFCCQMSQ